jgi:hypothetical protein
LECGGRWRVEPKDLRFEGFSELDDFKKFLDKPRRFVKVIGIPATERRWKRSADESPQSGRFVRSHINFLVAG